MSVHNPPAALLFDVFGTVVDWRSSISTALIQRSAKTLQSTADISQNARERATAMKESDWHTFAQEWRSSYGAFTKDFDPSRDTFISVDEHHYTSLKSLLTKYGLDGLWTSTEIKELSLAWHFLNPWADSVRGLEKLSEKFTTTTLSNGNESLLEDLRRHGPLKFDRIFSGEQFRAYKPNPLVYNGAAEKLGLSTGQCALVAAHLGDLKAAKGCGYQTVYVERPQEESYSDEEVLRAKEEGWVDMWVNGRGEGFLDVARRFGINISEKLGEASCGSE
ncbi:haloacid dehalogenase, type II [Polytolypa hystricis UAMH7299]|uniref:Haloacid dehalogenase, type II n=1 Tax=Polytolypa hystricis (strain UAMH7299) TaxID=1447883 RepID=A0A2B7Y918_POLH7|nr:haloacid dehalogenase, type II [Polytolypa hystricis UAMH7299]